MVVTVDSYEDGPVPFLKYAISKNKDWEIIGSSGVDQNQSIKGIANDFAVTRSLRPRIVNRYLHIIASFHPDDSVNNDLQRAISKEILRGISPSSSHMYPINIVINHKEKDHDHFHMLVARILPDGQKIDDSFIALRLMKLSEELERKYKLTIARERENLRKIELKKILIRSIRRNRDLILTNLNRDLDQVDYKATMSNYDNGEFVNIFHRKSRMKFSFHESQWRDEIPELIREVSKAQPTTYYNVNELNRSMNMDKKSQITKDKDGFTQ